MENPPKPKFDPKAFNEDPKFEQERTEFDAMLDAAAARRAAREKKKADEDAAKNPVNFFDWLFGGKP